MPKCVVIDQHALNIVGAALLEDSWFNKFDWPGASNGVRRVEIDRIAYLLSSRADESSRLLIIKSGTGGAFDGEGGSQHVLDRIIHVALASFERTVAVPINWRPFNVDNLYSVFSQPYSSGSGERVYFDRGPRGSDNLFVYAVTQNKDFHDVPIDLQLYDSAIGHYLDAVLSPAPTSSNEAGAYGIVLTAPTGNAIVGSATLSEWYDKKLTQQQRRFVDRKYDEPVRLKGAPGTGKTLSMAIKCLRDILSAENRSETLRFGFLTHSAAVAHETIPGIFDALDPTWQWRSLEHSSVWIGSLYELAEDLLQYQEKRLQPLSTDGREGRLFQALEISSAIDRLRKNTKFMLRDHPLCSDRFRAEFDKADENSRFVHDLMNEFACVIDADNIRIGTASAEKYIRAYREGWQMELPEMADREAVLQIHNEYLKELEKSDVLSMDQMIADFNRYLGTHGWNKLRDRLGYDALFVDELHFFNRAERMVFHSLFNGKTIAENRMPLFMSYDMKQSPADSFLGHAGGESARTFFKRIGAGESQLIELTKVFRSTPEITSFLSDLDAAFPALDLEDEWGGYTGSSDKPHGEKPQLTEYQRSQDLVDAVFKRAQTDAHEFGGKNVAVLCMNSEIYDVYLKAGRIANKFVELSARDQINELKYAGKRCVFSMPEYVAGLQFESVYLIHVDKAEMSEEADNMGRRRRFVSRCYLGASRAASKLEIAVSLERGGRSEILNVPLGRGSLVRAD